MIAVWDDHEVANDAWREGVENHQDDEGDYFERMAFALQAYAEWMPIRPAVDTDISSLYRSFQFGDLINLVMLDTRLVGRDLQLNLASYFTSDGSFDIAAFENDVNDENRSLLGNDQLKWLINQLNNTVTWQVLAQQGALLTLLRLPYNLDAWDGYANERKQIFEAAVANQSNLVVLAGDTHNA